VAFPNLARIQEELTPIERHVLGRAAVHCWRFDGDIPYAPPNAHQRAIAYTLAAPGVRLLREVTARPTFRLTGLGARIVKRLYRLVDEEWDIRREIEFWRMSVLMWNDWEKGGD